LKRLRAQHVRNNLRVQQAPGVSTGASSGLSATAAASGLASSPAKSTGGRSGS